MTAAHDLDRRLVAFLDEGPVRAPDRPVDAAIAHALAHPRRRDPFAPIRRDPMAPRAFAATLRPALVLAAAAALLAITAVAYVGSQRATTPAPLPTTVSPATPVPPSASPSSFSLVIPDTHDSGKRLIVSDRSGLLVEVRPGQADPNGAVVGDGIEVTADPDTPTEITLHWSDGPCENEQQMTIGSGARSIVLERPACRGDAIAGDHSIVLVLSEPVPVAEISTEIFEIGTDDETGGG